MGWDGWVEGNTNNHLAHSLISCKNLLISDICFLFQFFSTSINVLNPKTFVMSTWFLRNQTWTFMKYSKIDNLVCLILVWFGFELL